jgi:general secretion pathway protein D
MTVRSVLRLAALLFLSACLLACTANPALEESRQAFASGNTEAPCVPARQGGRRPRNLELRSYYLRQRDMLVVRQLAVAEQARAAGRYEEAEAALAMARQFDPCTPGARRPGCQCRPPEP